MARAPLSLHVTAINYFHTSFAAKREAVFNASIVFFRICEKRFVSACRAGNGYRHVEDATRAACGASAYDEGESFVLAPDGTSRHVTATSTTGSLALCDGRRMAVSRRRQAVASAGEAQLS
jgi:hypothetical protein